MDRYYGADLPLIIESTIKNNMKTISDEVDRLSHLMLLTAKHDWQRIKKSHPKNVDSVCQIMSQEIVRMSLKMSRAFRKAHDRITMRLNELVTTKSSFDSSDSDESQDGVDCSLLPPPINLENDRIRALRSMTGGERNQHTETSTIEARQVLAQQNISTRDAVLDLGSLVHMAETTDRFVVQKPLSFFGVTISPQQQISEPREAANSDDLNDSECPEPFDNDEKEEPVEHCIGSIYYSEIKKSDHLYYRHFRFSDISRPVSPSDHIDLQSEQTRALFGN